MKENVLKEMHATLNTLEAELKAVGWWQEIAPSVGALSSMEPFCVDTLVFSEWLQWVYLPKMRIYIEEHQSLPTASGLLPIASEAWRGCEKDTAILLKTVAQLDHLVYVGQI